MICIFSKHITPRLEYVVNFVFKDVLSHDFFITSDLEKAMSESVVINYSSEKIDHSISIIPNDLLFETIISEINPELGNWENTTTLFPNNSEKIPFDIFSAIFFLISRYEEYGSFKADEHGRFTAKDSFAYKNGFLEIPIVDIWLNQFGDFLEGKYDHLSLAKKKFRCTSTIDVDSAYAYLGKGIYRTIGGTLKDIIRFDFKNLINRFKTILRIEKDPFDTYDGFIELNKKNEVDSIFFFPLADYGPQDINLPHWSPRYIKLIKLLNKETKIGIHPGYVSSFYPKKIEIEINRLKEIANKEISLSRQHFLMLKFPATYRELIKNNIHEDFSLGFADHIGFRAGTSFSFKFFDLLKNEVTKLSVTPFCLMDVTLNLYMELSPSQATVEIDKMIDLLRKNNGHFIPLWHNESTSEKWHWKGWKIVYQKMIESAGTK